MSTKKKSKPDAANANANSDAKATKKPVNFADFMPAGLSNLMSPNFAQGFTPNFNFQPATKAMEGMMSGNKSQFDKLSQDAASFSKDGMEAVMQSFAVWMKGSEDMMKICMSSTQDIAEKQTAAMKAIMSCKTINELTETSNRICQENFDEMMSSATKFSEKAIKVATEALDPINDQVTKVMKKAGDTMAA